VAALICQLGARSLRSGVLQFLDYQDGDLADLRAAGRVATAHGASVNVFATRHGARYVLHGTLLMRADAPCADAGALEQLVVERAAARVPGATVVDLYFRVDPVAFPKSGGNISDENAAAFEAAFRQRLEQVIAFHGVPSHEVRVDWPGRRVEVLTDDHDDTLGTADDDSGDTVAKNGGGVIAPPVVAPAAAGHNSQAQGCDDHVHVHTHGDGASKMAQNRCAHPPREDAKSPTEASSTNDGNGELAVDDCSVDIQNCCRFFGLAVVLVKRS
jgi:hypothetical protein